MSNMVKIQHFLSDRQHLADCRRIPDSFALVIGKISFIRDYSRNGQVGEV